MSATTGADIATAIESVAEGRPPLDVEANLAVTVDGVRLAVASVDGRVRVQVPSVAAAASLLSSEGDRLPALARLAASAGVTAEVRIGDAIVAVGGTDADPGRVSRLLSLGPVEVRSTELAAAALRFK